MSELVQREESAARTQILALQDAIFDAGGTQDLDALGCVLKHYYSPGLYARELFIPAGVVVVGKIHRHSHHNTISCGRVHVVTEFGSEVYEGHVSFVSQPGIKRAVYAETDVIWTTYHPTVVCEVETDLEKIEARVIAPSFEELDRLTYADIKGYIQ